MTKDRSNGPQRPTLEQPSDFVSFRNKRKARRIVADLESISAILCTAKRLLSSYEKYIPAKEVIDVIASNELLIKLHISKFKKALDDEG